MGPDTLSWQRLPSPTGGDVRQTGAEAWQQRIDEIQILH